MEADAQRHTAFSRRELSNQIRAETLSWKSQSRRLAKRLLDGGDLNDNLIRSSLKSGYRRGWIWASLFGAQKIDRTSIIRSPRIHFPFLQGLKPQA